MNADAASIDASSTYARAGFWRRWLAIIIDVLIVLLPFQALAAALFAMSAGMIQMNSGVFHACTIAKTIPQGLDPPPPHDSNFKSVCRTSFFGATTSSSLMVAHVTREGHTTKSVSQVYALDKDGKPIKANSSVEWIFQLTLIAYFVVMVSKTGRTLGGRVMGIRIVDTASPQAGRVSLGKTIIRYVAIFIGAAPALALLLYQDLVTDGSADAVFSDGFFKVMALTFALGAAWALVLFIQIVRKTDPVYDRLAGTAVLRAITQGPVPPALPGRA